MTKNFIFSIPVFAILVLAQFASAAPSCYAPATTLNCGGTLVVDQGCSKQSCDQYDEAFCDAPECHILDKSDLFLCAQEPNCVTGATDGLTYVINHSSCFCD